MKKSGNISRLFDDIANRYDFLNHVLSLNTDTIWRRRLVDISGVSEGEVVLDVCTGTGDIEICFAKRTCADKIFGIDFSRAMLEVGAKKIEDKGYTGKITNFMGDSLSLPFGNSSFDVVTIGFGLRNLTDYSTGISEMVRVLRGGGRLLLLEFAPPKRIIIDIFYRFYLKRILPIIGGILTGKKSAYEYLSDSISGFLEPSEVMRVMEAEGLKKLESFALMGGVAYIYFGEK
jgi:demethylmenaquinone methyltransferase / 2-methoxy-6-polyprenyl-1,4-benzoquinol methylase